MPRLWPRGMMVALWMVMAPSVRTPTRAWPASWYAVLRALSGVITADRRSAPIKILSLAHSKTCMVMASRPSTLAFTAAWFMRLYRSAPDIPVVPRARMLRSTSSETLVLAAYISRISFRPPTSGSGTATCLSNLPGRSRAVSSDSAKFVAPMTMIPLFSSNPSICTSSSFSVCFSALWSLSFRLPPSASISSMKMMAAVDFALAASNSSRTRLAPRPT
mmetsp:Transcript_56653/g.120306  ORF Transcript_56653/g.120306 Transcript_56653/m.120306 type:complete len:219 (+) Transcript_56653:670-1326(+)